MNYYGRHFVFEMGKAYIINYLHVEPAFYFYSHRLSDYWSKRSKGSYQVTCISDEMKDFHKIVQFHTLEIKKHAIF